MAGNIAQFFGKDKRLGETVTLPFNGDHFIAADGSEWKAASNALKPYTADYAGLLTDAPGMLTSAVNLPGPFPGGLWNGKVPYRIVGSQNGIWLMTLSGVWNYYYTSTDQGETWTRRTAPLSGKAWVPLFDGINFILYALGTTANAVQESTDAINWTGHTGVSIANIADFQYVNGLYVAWPVSGTVAATSTDRANWTSRTVNGTTTGAPGFPSLTYNAGAVLWIALTSTQGQYQTSPDFTTWTLRTGIDHEYFGSSTNNMGMASNATTTIVMGVGLSYAYTTDGINWLDGLIDAGYLTTANASGPIIYDGSRFLAYVGDSTYYSTTGLPGSWTKSPYGRLGSGTRFLTPKGVAVANFQKAVHVLDFAANAPVNILYPSATTDAAIRTYARIK